MTITIIPSSPSGKIIVSPVENDCQVVAIVKGDVKGKENVPLRIHSECFTGDLLWSRLCDCGAQLRG